MRRFQLSVPWAMAKIEYEQPQVSVGRQGQVHKQELLFPLREEDMAHQQNTDMWLSSKNSTNYNGNPNYTFRKLSGVDSNLSFAYTTK